MKYHSALHSAEYDWPPAERVELPGGIAFVHDLTTGPQPARLPPEYDVCDVLYSDIPWKAGWTRFHERAESRAVMSHEGFLQRVRIAVMRSGKPAVIVCGTNEARQLEPPVVCASTLNGGGAMLCLFNGAIVGAARSAEETLEFLAHRHTCIGDFCAGYGRSGRVFWERGKRFVLSDINPYCIGFIRDTLGVKCAG